MKMKLLNNKYLRVKNNNKKHKILKKLFLKSKKILKSQQYSM